MGYQNGNYNGKIYIGTVKWGNDYKHVMDFGNAANRDTFLKNHLTEMTGKIGLIPNPNGYIDLSGIVQNIENKNYLYYCNSDDISNVYYCCFITNYEILAMKTTRVYIELDIFQQYFYDASFYRCILERAHISKTEDNNNWNKYTAPEPVGAASEIDAEVTAFSDISFVPILIMDALSKPQTPSGSTQLQYDYGGTGSATYNLTGYYRFRTPTDEAERVALIYAWSLAEEETSTINHLSDIIGFNFIPKWLNDAADWQPYTEFPQGYVYELANNAVETVSDTVSLIRTSGGNRILACGYAPTNKKLFTNLCRSYKLWTKNGVCVPIAPNKLNNQNSLTINISQRPMGSTYKIELVNYKDVNSKFFDLQYSFSIAFGINNNVGTAQQTALTNLSNQAAVLSASQKEQAVNQTVGVVNTAMGTITGGVAGILSGDYVGAAQSLISGVGSLVSQGAAIERAGTEITRDNFNMQTAINDAVSSITASIGNNSDRTAMTDDFCKLRIAETSPTAENCRIIDDFLTVYGYAISEIKNPNSYFRTRPLFNYIKTNNCNLTAAAPNRFKSILKSIFDSGVTLWHYDYREGQQENRGYANFGNYDKDNF